MRTYTKAGDQAGRALDLLLKHDDAQLEGSIVFDAITQMRGIIADSAGTNEYLNEVAERLRSEAKIRESADAECLSMARALCRRLTEAVRIDGRYLLLRLGQGGFGGDQAADLKEQIQTAVVAQHARDDKHL